MKRNIFEEGQALVLVLLSLAVVLTIVLYIFSRTVTDISVSSSSEAAVRAFSAAEAGVEQSLVVGQGLPLTNFANGASYQSSVTSFAEGSFDYNYPLEMSSGDSATVWFIAHDASGNMICDATHTCFTGTQMKVCWGKPGTTSNPAIEASLFYESVPGSVATIKIGRVTYDPNASRRSSNFFSAPDLGNCTIGSDTYAYQKIFNFSSLGVPAGSYGSQNGLQYVRFKMLYNTTTSETLGISVNFPSSTTLPSQGQMISSTGTAGDSNRKLDVFQGWPEIPFVFENGVYNPNALTK